jgi:hypothetical protein
MKNSQLKSFLLRLLTLITILLILYYLSNNNSHSSSYKTPTNNEIKEQEQIKNVQDPLIETSTPKVNNQMIPKENDLNKKGLLQKQMEIKLDDQIPSALPVNNPMPKIKTTLYSAKTNECAKIDYSQYIKTYQLNNDFKYLLQAYCENTTKQTIEPYELLTNIFIKINNTSLIEQKEATKQLIDKLQTQWGKIVRE